MNTYSNQIIQWVFAIYIQHKHDTQIPGEDDKASENFKSYKDEKFILEEQDIKGDHRNSVDKSLNIKICSKNGL